MEQGRRKITVDDLEALSTVFDTHIGDLILPSANPEHASHDEALRRTLFEKFYRLPYGLADAMVGEKGSEVWTATVARTYEAVANMVLRSIAVEEETGKRVNDFMPSAVETAEEMELNPIVRERLYRYALNITVERPATTELAGEELEEKLTELRSQFPQETEDDE